MAQVFIEVLTSPDSPQSAQALKVAKKVAAKKFNAQIILRETSTATQEGAAKVQEYEVNSVPAIALNGRVAFVGAPNELQLERLVKKFVDQEEYRTSYFF